MRVAVALPRAPWQSRRVRSLVHTDPEHLPAALGAEGWAVVRAAAMLPWLRATAAALAPLAATWDDLPPDTYLRDGGHYRSRRHGCFEIDAQSRAVTAVPHRAHWQPPTYNALHGGIERWFSPIQPAVREHPVFARLVVGLGEGLSRLADVPRWYVEAHQFRVDTTGGIGRPTPEGAHRDGVDFVAVVLVGRHEIKGGETRVFEADGPLGVRFTLDEPWSALVLDDRRVIHESTPIQPLGERGYRDTLVLTYRSGGFQSPQGG
jgi:hypothetical protein